MSSKLPLSRIYGTIYGNCIGDAIGLLTEFMTKEEAKQKYPPDGLEYHHKVDDSHRSNWKNGDWTDDSDQMILMMLSILERKGKVDAADYGQKIMNWAKYGFPELGDKGGNGLGATTLHVLRNKYFKGNPHLAAETVWREMGCSVAPNGAVMRTSLMGIYQYEDLDKVTKNTLEFCKVTHADYRCQASCVAVTRALALMLQGEHKTSEMEFDIEAIIKESFDHAKEFIPKACELQREYIEELHNHMYAKSIEDLQLDEHHKIGYTYKTLGAGFWALRQSDFKSALQKIVMEAGDADTNGAVAGALLGCKLGVEGLPGTWLKGLIHKDWLDDIIKKFLQFAFKDKPTPPPRQKSDHKKHEPPSNMPEDSPRSAPHEPGTAGRHDDERHKSQNTGRQEGHGGTPQGPGPAKLQTREQTGAERKPADRKKQPDFKPAHEQAPFHTDSEVHKSQTTNRQESHGAAPQGPGPAILPMSGQTAAERNPADHKKQSDFKEASHRQQDPYKEDIV